MSDNKKCEKKRSMMLSYGIIQLGSSVISAIALSAIAFSLCSIKKEAKVFNDCVEEIQATGQSSSQAIRYCNGGNN